MTIYCDLCAEFYDLSKPKPGPREWSFYNELLKKHPGPVLEAMCGSGRLLIPLLQQGYDISGVDASSAMLQRCQKRCDRHSLPVQLYQQFLQQLCLPQQYVLIFIAIGSFQHIRSFDEAQKVLHRLRSALAPQGSLVLELFAPQQHIQHPISFRWAVPSSPNGEVIHNAMVHPVEQDVLINRMRYERWEHGICKDTAEEEWYVRTYQKEQIYSLLHQAGFSKIVHAQQSFELNPQAIIYTACT